MKTKQAPAGLQVRWMVGRDIPAVMDIEEAAFENPWPEEELRACLRMRNCIGIVAEDAAGEVVGFLVYEWNGRRFRVLNVAVRFGRERRGIGRTLVDALKSKLALQKREAILLDVRERNLPGQLFFKAMGFRYVGTRHDAYEDSDEAAYTLRYAPNAEPASLANRLAGYFRDEPL